MVPLADVLCRSGHELRNLAHIADHLQVIINGLILEGDKAYSKELSELQHLDRLQQAISGIATFLDALAATAPPHWLVDANQASRAVNLSDLASRLSCFRCVESTSHSPLSGDCQFF